MTFGSNTTVLQKFEKMLQSKGFSLDALDTASVYSFVLGCNEFSLFPLAKDYLILRSIYKPGTTAETAEATEFADPMLAFRESSLRPFTLNLDNKSYSITQNIIKSVRQNMFLKLFKEGLPINYFILYHDKVFQYSTPLFDKLWKYYTHQSAKSESPSEIKHST